MFKTLPFYLEESFCLFHKYKILFLKNKQNFHTNSLSNNMPFIGVFMNMTNFRDK